MIGGGEAFSKRGILTLKYPIEHGIVTNWDDVEKLMHHLFYNELRMAPEECPLVFSVAPHSSKATREKATQILFETFNVPALAMVSEATLIAQASGMENALVVSSGDGCTWACPVVDQKAIESAVQVGNYGGKDVTEKLRSLLLERAYDCATSSAGPLLQGLKAEFCFVSQSYQRDLAVCTQNPTPFRRSPEMPDGSKWDLDKERFMAPEILFSRDEGLPVHQLCIDALGAMENAYDMDRLWRHIVLAGGNTLFPGFARRLTSELKRIAPSRVSGVIKVQSPVERMYSSFMGGSTLGKTLIDDLLIGDTPKKMIMKEEYDEIGPSICHTKYI